AEAALTGVPPMLHPYRSRAEQVQLLEGCLHELLADKDLLPEQILLLSPYRRENTCLAGRDNLVGRQLIDFGRRQTVRGDSGVLFYETVPSFKGCETECVLLHDVAGSGPAVDLQSLYVACSRPRVALHVFHDH